MELPNYFFADLPDPGTLTPALVTDACHELKRNRARYLEPRSTESVIEVLAGLARDWLEPGFELRERALEEGQSRTGFSRQTIEAGLRRLFSGITRESLRELVKRDLGEAGLLDGFAIEKGKSGGERASIARGPALLAQITGGVLPDPVVTSIMLGLLAKSAQFIKCASGTSFLPRMFAHSIYLVEPKLGSCLEIAEWKGGTAPLEEALFAEADCVTATGDDATLEAIRSRLPARARFIGYGHRLSFAYITSEMLAKMNAGKVAAAAAADVAAWNQQGCLSPHVIYLESGGATAPRDFAELLAGELRRIEELEPRGELSPEEAGAITTRRMFYEVRAAHDDGTRVLKSEGSTTWTIVLEEDPGFQTSCLNRFVYVKMVAGLEQLLQAVSQLEGKVSTVGLAAPVNRAQEIATRLARWGATRICPLGRMQQPPITWRHDGRPSLGDLVTWTDWEL